MRLPRLPSRSKPRRNRASLEQPARIVLMESISERERPARHRKKQVTALRTVVRAAIWVAVLLAMFGVLAWRLMAQ